MLSQRSGKPFDLPPAQTVVLKAIAAPDIRREQPNVLTVDYVDVTAGGEPRPQILAADSDISPNDVEPAAQILRKLYPDCILAEHVSAYECS